MPEADPLPCCRAELEADIGMPSARFLPECTTFGYGLAARHSRWGRARLCARRGGGGEDPARCAEEPRAGQGSTRPPGLQATAGRSPSALRLEVDHKLELGWPLHRQVAGLAPLGILSRNRGAAKLFHSVGP